MSIYFRIKENPKAFVVPIIDVIDDKTLEYYHGNGNYFQVWPNPNFKSQLVKMDIQKIIFQVGGFTWSGHFTWVDIPPSELARRGSPIAPTRYIHLLVFCCCFCMSFSSSLCPGPQPWLVDCLLLPGTHSGLWAPTTQRWMSGEVRPSSWSWSETWI